MSKSDRSTVTLPCIPPLPPLLSYTEHLALGRKSAKYGIVVNNLPRAYIFCAHCPARMFEKEIVATGIIEYDGDRETICQIVKVHYETYHPNVIYKMEYIPSRPFLSYRTLPAGPFPVPSNTIDERRAAATLTVRSMVEKAQQNDKTIPSLNEQKAVYAIAITMADDMIALDAILVEYLARTCDEKNTARLIEKRCAFLKQLENGVFCWGVEKIERLRREVEEVVLYVKSWSKVENLRRSGNECIDSFEYDADDEFK